MPQKRRGMKPRLYDLHGSRMSVKRFAEALNIPLSTAYWHIHKCGGDMAAAYARAERTRTRRAEQKIMRIIAEGKET